MAELRAARFQALTLIVQLITANTEFNKMVVQANKSICISCAFYGTGNLTKQSLNEWHAATEGQLLCP